MIDRHLLHKTKSFATSFTTMRLNEGKNDEPRTVCVQILLVWLSCHCPSEEIRVVHVSIVEKP